MSGPKVVRVLREAQERDPVLGPLFQALHTFADRLREEFFSDEPKMPHPVIAMEKDRGKRLGYYTERDGYLLLHRINLNPYALRTGSDAAETLAHEMVHLWQWVIGRPCKNNYHGREFHEKMAEMGIISTGRNGYHADFEERWLTWMTVDNHDLGLPHFILPGMDAEPTRKMKKLQCPECGNSFRNRRVINVLCMDCDAPFELVAPSARKASHG